MSRVEIEKMTETIRSFVALHERPAVDGPARRGLVRRRLHLGGSYVRRCLALNPGVQEDRILYCTQEGGGAGMDACR